MNNVQNFDIDIESMIIKTPNFLIIDKLEESGGRFIDPKTNVFSLPHSTDEFEKVSNRFSKNGYIYFCKLSALSADLTNDFVIFPQIYKHEISTSKTSLIYPSVSENFKEDFQLSRETVRYIKSDAPKLTYNTRNNLFNLSFILKDQNDSIELVSVDFDESPDITILSRRVSKLTIPQESNILNTLSALNTYSLSGVSIIGEEIII